MPIHLSRNRVWSHSCPYRYCNLLLELQTKLIDTIKGEHHRMLIVFIHITRLDQFGKEVIIFRNPLLDLSNHLLCELVGIVDDRHSVISHLERDFCLFCCDLLESNWHKTPDNALT